MKGDMMNSFDKWMQEKIYKDYSLNHDVQESFDDIAIEWGRRASVHSLSMMLQDPVYVWHLSKRKAKLYARYIIGYIEDKEEQKDDNFAVLRNLIAAQRDEIDEIRSQSHLTKEDAEKIKCYADKRKFAYFQWRANKNNSQGYVNYEKAHLASIDFINSLTDNDASH